MKRKSSKTPPPPQPPAALSTLPESQWHVYIVRCADGTLYTGITNDLARRFDQHNSGKGARYTRGRGPVKLVFSEPQSSHSEAARREFVIKSLTKAGKLRLIRAART